MMKELRGRTMSPGFFGEDCWLPGTERKQPCETEKRCERGEKLLCLQ